MSVLLDKEAPMRLAATLLLLAIAAPAARAGARASTSRAARLRAATSGSRARPAGKSIRATGGTASFKTSSWRPGNARQGRARRDVRPHQARGSHPVQPRADVYSVVNRGNGAPVESPEGHASLVSGWQGDVIPTANKPDDPRADRARRDRSRTWRRFVDMPARNDNGVDPPRFDG